MGVAEGVNEASNANGGSQLHVAMFPFLAFGHISPFVQLSKKLAASGATVTLLTAPANAPRIASMLAPFSAPSVRIATLNVPRVDGLPAGAESTADLPAAAAELLKVAVDLMRPDVSRLLAELRPHAVFFDFSQPWLPSVAHPLGIKAVFFSVFSAVSTAFLTVPARRPDGAAAADVQKALEAPPPGFPPPPKSTLVAVPPYQAADFAYIFKRLGGPPVFDRVLSCMENSSAIVMKSCKEMEGHYIEYIETQYQKPVLLAGPVVPDPPTGDLDPRWARWLDGFPEKSVVFCSFGSETFLPDKGIKELALGLEMSGLPFFLVLNFPRGEEGEDDADGPMKTLRRKLPEGLEERVAGRGAVHSGWVQQQHILAHQSVGCFLCHSGVSSLTEGVVGGCQLVLLPQRGDQFLNARLFAGDLGAAVEVRRGEGDGGFTREDVREALGRAMGEDGKEVRERHGRWREFLMDDGVHRTFTEEFARKLKEHVGVQ